MTPAPHAMATTLRDNIESLTARQRADAEAAPFGDRAAVRITAFTGSMLFVVLHLVVVGLWVAVNTGALPIVPAFNESFVVLAMVASVESLFLSTFVLISQNRMAALAERRADLDLHVSLLAEHELTKLADLVTRIAERLGVPVDNRQFDEIRKNVEPEAVLDALDEHRIEDE